MSRVFCLQKNEKRLSLNKTFRYNKTMFTTIKKIIPKKIFKLAQPYYHFGLNFFASFWYRNPSNKLIVIGVTGTTGKTTLVYLIAKMLQNAGFGVGYTSTAMFGDGKTEWLNDKKMTMPGRFFTQKILANMVKNKCQFAIVETTSEGIVQFRHKFINYDILIFTGLYPEHIDSHGSFENYKQAKGRLFAHLKNCKVKNSSRTTMRDPKLDLPQVKKTIIVNGDDEHANYFFDFWSEEKYQLSMFNYQSSIPNCQNISFGNIQNSNQGISFNIKDTDINLQFLGEFNAINASLAAAVGLSAGLKLEKIKKGLESIKGIPGRLEKIDEGQKFNVIVDYAYEPKAVTKLYDTIKHVNYNKIIHVLGSAGGGRDVSRRFILGKLAGEKCDIVIVTNEDPYDDDPQVIIDQVAQGAINAGKKIDQDLFKIEDRREAIKKALASAKENDMVLITGKGCEQAICVANEKKIKWDDRKVVRKLLDELTNKRVSRNL